MSRETPDTKQWLEDNRNLFVQTGEIANKIGKQNEVYSELVESDQVSTQPLKEVVSEHLTEEQAKSFQLLRESQASVPYEELAARERNLYNGLGDVAFRLSTVEEQVKDETASIFKEAELVAERLPELAPRLGEIALYMEQSLLAEATQRLEAERAARQSEYDELRIVYDEAATAWPIPRLVFTGQAEAIGAVVEKEVSGQPEAVVEVDDLSEEILPTKEQIADSVRQKYPRESLKGASEFIGLFLAEEPGRVYSVEELAGIMNGTEEDIKKKRVTSLIFNFEHGITNIIGRILEERDLVFQRGRRRGYRKSTKEPFGRSRSVYRAMPVEDSELNEQIVRTEEDVDWVDDNWRTVTPGSGQSKVSSDTAEGLLTETTEPKESVDIDLHEEQKTLAVQAEPEPLPLPVETPRQEAKKKPEPEWKQDFRKDVGEAIAQFEADGLMVEEPLSWKYVKVRSSSRTLGTETMAERAVSNRIISKIEGSSSDNVLPVEKFVAMALQNSHPEIFSHRSRRKQALAIVEQAVTSYFEKARSRQKE